MHEQSAPVAMRGYSCSPWFGVFLQRMSGTKNAASEGVSKVQIKRQIKTIVEDLENILGDLKDVAKELKEVGCIRDGTWMMNENRIVMQW